jgi:hypothetical protein
MPGWDTTIETRDGGAFGFNQMDVMHGPNCEPPAPGVSHQLTTFDDQMFTCAGHFMMAIDGPQGQHFAIPGALVDFSKGEAIVRFDRSSLKTSGREWSTFWLMPFDTNLADPHNQFPAEGIFWNSSSNKLQVFRNHVKERFGVGSFQVALAEMGLQPSARRRDTYEMRISTTHFSVRVFDGTGDSRVLIDHPIDPPLAWTRALFYIGVQSYSPQKAGTNDDCEEFGITCDPGTANTWHFDNVSIEPAIPFTIIHGPRAADGGNNQPLPVVFDAPAPANAWARFQLDGAALNAGHTVELSLDGVNWVPAQLQPKGAVTNKWTVFHPIPEGTQQIWVRGSKWTFLAFDLNIWALGEAPTP